jgi:hypothetical protein
LPLAQHVFGQVRVNSEIFRLDAAHIENVFLPGIVPRTGASGLLAAPNIADETLALGDQVDDFPVDGGQFFAQVVKTHIYRSY